MGHYVKTQVTRCHYGEAKPDCPICHGGGRMNPLANDPDFQLPCECRLEGMTFEEPVDELMAVEVEPLPDGGARIHMKRIELSSD